METNSYLPFTYPATLYQQAQLVYNGRHLHQSVIESTDIDFRFIYVQQKCIICLLNSLGLLTVSIHYFPLSI